MTSKPIISINGVLREMNAQELEQFELDLLESANQKQIADAQAAAKESAVAKLSALGLTTAEIAAIGLTGIEVTEE
jgi:hypothetical protein